MKLKIFCIVFIVMSLFSCSKEGDKQANKNYKHKLILYATEEFRKSGFEHSIVPDFQNKHNCKLEVVLFPNTAELCNAVKDKKNYGKYDLAIGIDNSFAVSETLAAYFVPPESFNEDSLIKETMFDPSLRLIPFAYSNLSLVYNVSLIKNPPQSFGELQDAKYLA
ncbi:MAG: thiamine ABC transporter substrate-binding protein, partial [Candidatus Cloacimonas sp.]